ncbi:MAG: tRNA (adenosine(37)-N6)-threonylcarbamoyltransferase complex ATPase subunit type 1 TsaE [Actinobacteria bacterium]|uniref:tRNA threonylcarbamoyladenosine biosynthesis protein TsaE n=1 Tax=freshwater metagenome TaxID=449393 RepID=A0A6J5ZUN0_9ZZZZ|nr:tRNA (adenosine(37)-N6)-threonylcarbamoyltransferase complex ATPase subunit type 1 TsaE [Actinomycetota bacterium]
MGAGNTVVSTTAQQTEDLAADLALDLKPGDVVHVCGEVGAGKTTFVRGACAALGVDGPVTSPSYTICNRYVGKDVLISHLDCQRLEGASGEESGIFDDEVAADRITFIEWPQSSVESVGMIALVPAAVRIELSHRSPDTRLIKILRGNGPR